MRVLQYLMDLQVSRQSSNFVPPSDRYAGHTLIRAVSLYFYKQLLTLSIVTDGIHNVYTPNFFPRDVLSFVLFTKSHISEITFYVYLHSCVD